MISEKNTMERPVALVTGASTGIGAAVAKRLGDEGYFVWVNYASSHQAAEELVQTIIESGGVARKLCANVGSVQEIRNMFAEIRAVSGRLDVLVNNAGICPFLNWDEITPEDWDKTHHINLRGAFFCSQEAGKLMIEKNLAGRIMVMSSISDQRRDGSSSLLPNQGRHDFHDGRLCGEPGKIRDHLQFHPSWNH